MTLQHLLLLNLVLAAMLCGLIWLVQLVLYPGLWQISKEGFPAYHQQHMRRISFVVIPLMLLELFTALYLLFQHFTFRELSYLNYAAFGLLTLVWLATFLRAVPLHMRLRQKGQEPKLLKSLIRINWLRTITWSLRLVLLFVLSLLYI